MNALNKILLIAFTFLLPISLIPSSVTAEDLSTATSTVGSAFLRDLTLGSHGDDVSMLQQFLITGGFLKILTPTGYFGPLTRTALGTWQSSVSIAPSIGYFGHISRGQVNTTFQQTLIHITGAESTTGTASTIVEATGTQATAGTTSTAIMSSPDGSPARLLIPKLNINAGFQYNGTKPDGAMEIPNNVVDVGWFTESVHPGEKGTAIVTGHVAQIRGGIQTKPGVFANLGELRAGDKLTVQNKKGEVLMFMIRESRLYDPTADATDVFTANDDGVHMNLITCEGTWNPGQLSFSQRLVVFTDLVP